MSNLNPGDLAGRNYWDSIWDGASRVGIRKDWATLSFQRLFNATCLEHELRGGAYVEFGCANSPWLSYFALEQGMQVTGIDFSPQGAALARETLAATGAPGKVVCGDFFQPDPDHLGAFDLGFSFGVAEHFEDTAACLSAFGRYLRPGGILVTFIPNLAGACGSLQSVLHRPVFDRHVVLLPADLASAHASAGFKVLSCQWFLSSDFAIPNLSGHPVNAAYWGKRALLALLRRLSRWLWALESRGLKLPVSNRFSPYIVCLAVKPRGANAPQLG